MRSAPSPRPRWWRSAIRRRFSVPVRRSSTAENCPVTPIAARMAIGSVARSCPATAISPASGAINVVSTFTVVVLPDPFGPSSAKTLPAGSRGRCRRAREDRRRTCGAPVSRWRRWSWPPGCNLDATSRSRPLDIRYPTWRDRVMIRTAEPWRGRAKWSDADSLGRWCGGADRCGVFACGVVASRWR